MSERICSIEGCDRERLARGVCGKHYYLSGKTGHREFPLRSRSRGSTCIRCGQARVRLRPGSEKLRCPQCYRDSFLRKTFGINLADYEALSIAQGGRCAGCWQPETATRLGTLKSLAVDHDHVTGAVRGLLCQSCNLGLGQLGDDPQRLENLAAYLRKWQGR